MVHEGDTHPANHFPPKIGLSQIRRESLPCSPARYAQQGRRVRDTLWFFEQQRYYTPSLVEIKSWPGPSQPYGALSSPVQNREPAPSDTTHIHVCPVIGQH